MLSQKLLPDLVRDFVIAGHGNLPKVKEMLTQNPGLLNAAYPWSEKDQETAIEAAAQVGSVTVAEYLISKGAPLSICTAAMLGRIDEVKRILEQDPENITATGAHGISLLTHAALSGNTELVEMLFQNGARSGVSSALHNAVGRGHHQIAQWLLENGKPDLTQKNFQGKTALTVAKERNDGRMIQLLQAHGASE